jgi:peroxiredoxin
VLSAGDRIPEATVRLESREQLELPALLADGPILLFFYLFDWSMR